jgi:F-type H+/Na+-transporting ATPase subunit beta
VAEAFTNRPELCDGKWDHLPENAFMYIGNVEEAAEQAKKAAG